MSVIIFHLSEETKARAIERAARPRHHHKNAFFAQPASQRNGSQAVCAQIR
nr:MAG TPA: hypothetical protein [Bacteriophage sp.]